MGDSLQRIDEKLARELWARAAELQTAGRDAAGGSAATSRPGGLTLDVVLHAAEGAGIQPESVLLALAERQLVDWDSIRPDDWRTRLLKLLVSKADAIDVQRVFRAEPERVLTAFAEVASRPAFDLALERAIGRGESPTDRVYVFRRQGASWSGFSGGLEAADVRVLLVTIRATQDGTVVRIRAPLFRRGLNLGLAGVSSGLLSVFGAAAGLSVGSGILAPLIGSLVAVPVGAIAAYATIGAGFFGGGSVGLVGYRAFYRGMVRRGELALHGLFSAVAAEVEPALIPSVNVSREDDRGHRTREIP